MAEPEMIERVRSAILAAMRAHGEVVYVDATPRSDGTFRLDGDFDLAALARAAIEAMREPTDSMSVNGGLELEEQMFAQQGLVFDGAKAVFQRMIDAALADPAQPR